MKLEDVDFGFGHEYRHKQSGRKCYVVNCHFNDGAALVVELCDEEGVDLSGELRMSEACFLEPWETA